MTQKEKFILLQDLSARLPYGMKLDTPDGVDTLGNVDTNVGWINASYDVDEVKPYLRSMSSMTAEEKDELLNLLFDKEDKYFYIDEEGHIDGKTSDLMKEGLNYPSFCPINIIIYTDWLYSHYLDFRGLIPKGLALEAPKDMYNEKR